MRQNGEDLKHTQACTAGFVFTAVVSCHRTHVSASTGPTRLGH